MSTHSPEKTTEISSSSKTSEPSHFFVSDELSETESEDSGLCSSLVSGLRDGELLRGRKALWKDEKSHFTKTGSCDMVTSDRVAQEYLPGEQVMVLDTELKHDILSSSGAHSHDDKMVADDFNNLASIDPGLKRYHSCQVLDTIPNFAWEFGPGLSRRSTESNLGHAHGGLRKSLLLSMSELSLVGKGLPVFLEAREGDPVGEGDAGEFTTVHYKSPETALRTSRY